MADSFSKKTYPYEALERDKATLYRILKQAHNTDGTVKNGVIEIQSAKREK